MRTEPTPSNHEVRYEKTDALPRPLYQFLFWICVLTLVTAGVSWVTFAWLTSWREGASERAAMAAPEDSQQPPAPRLQTREPRDLAAFTQQEAEFLSTYGVLDREKGAFHIPIEEAMKLTLERGLPVASPSPLPEPKASPLSAGKETPKAAAR
jgi:hypothetical protein